MSPSPDLYEVLQVSPNADPDVITAAYHRLARKYHPDVSTASGANERMKDLNAAYEILSDPARRARYHAWRARQRQARSESTAQTTGTAQAGPTSSSESSAPPRPQPPPPRPQPETDATPPREHQRQPTGRPSVTATSVALVVVFALFILFRMQDSTTRQAAPTPTADATHTAAPTSTVEPTSTELPTNTPMPTSTIAPTSTRVPTPTVRPTNTPEPPRFPATGCIANTGGMGVALRYMPQADAYVLLFDVPSQIEYTPVLPDGKRITILNDGGTWAKIEIKWIDAYGKRYEWETWDPNWAYWAYIPSQYWSLRCP